ncbi:hypothetical protein Kpol_1061p23 [Vanderwaltozyma polyspora DSM 70294]|uniref:Uncharacterized protein n=1 Tax=Vanderwaltozyma polyspora (strain ATCC 22028 / DSM 70294 / BCRC 21397 / CBS 2163 / NBRC 10782 / NRRL Y-8283 / UCD 57-17) TaxID=436907 RepID=A7TJE9_VANPO|nr:uncharacterized protein Kpol_1061p23 [Vanderwaltozyma polyspora DSM 70294]EDO17599.1 hypothetical protein Kpol_1061p23 [Vanderwaltozyma polyspora DSM 70294]
MFVDYSGLQRFQPINEEFLKQYIKLYQFYKLPSIQEKIYMVNNELEKINKSNSLIYNVSLIKIEQIFCLSICLQQMIKMSDIIKRCPTIYILELQVLSCSQFKKLYFDYEDNNHHEKDTVTRLIMELRREYRNLTIELYESVKNLIITLKPRIGESFSYKNWNILQKFIFYKISGDKMKKPQNINLIKIKNAIMNEQLIMDDNFQNIFKKFQFYKFNISKINQQNLENFNYENLKLIKTSNKISLYLKDSNRIYSIPNQKKSIKNKSTAKQPAFLELFKENQQQQQKQQQHQNHQHDTYENEVQNVNNKENYTGNDSHENIHQITDVPSTQSPNIRSDILWVKKSKPLGEIDPNRYSNSSSKYLSIASLPSNCDSKEESNSSIKSELEPRRISKSRFSDANTSIISFNDQATSNSENDRIYSSADQTSGEYKIKSLEDLTFKEFLRYKFTKSKQKKTESQMLFYCYEKTPQ